jgi:hypothetical protein
VIRVRVSKMAGNDRYVRFGHSNKALQAGHFSFLGRFRSCSASSDLFAVNGVPRDEAYSAH